MLFVKTLILDARTFDARWEITLVDCCKELMLSFGVRTYVAYWRLNFMSVNPVTPACRFSVSVSLPLSEWASTTRRLHQGEWSDRSDPTLRKTCLLAVNIGYSDNAQNIFACKDFLK